MLIRDAPKTGQITVDPAWEATGTLAPHRVVAGRARSGLAEHGAG